MSYQLGPTTFIQSGFLTDEKIESSNDSWLHRDDFASCFESGEYPIENRICQTMNYKGKGLGLHEQGVQEPVYICAN